MSLVVRPCISPTFFILSYISRLLHPSACAVKSTHMAAKAKAC